MAYAIKPNCKQIHNLPIIFICSFIQKRKKRSERMKTTTWEKRRLIDELLISCSLLPPIWRREKETKKRLRPNYLFSCTYVWSHFSFSLLVSHCDSSKHLLNFDHLPPTPKQLTLLIYYSRRSKTN